MALSDEQIKIELDRLDIHTVDQLIEYESEDVNDLDEINSSIEFVLSELYDRLLYLLRSNLNTKSKYDLAIINFIKNDHDIKMLINNPYPQNYQKFLYVILNIYKNRKILS